MNRIYTLRQRIVACFLLFGLFLQSCGGQNQLVPQEKKLTKKTLELLNNPLVNTNKEIVISGGYLASFYQEDGELKADLRADEIQPQPNYKGIPVVIEKSIDLSNIIKLDPTTQQQRIQFKSLQDDQLGYVKIFGGALRGGMWGGNDYEEKEKEKEGEEKHVDDFSNSQTLPEFATQVNVPEAQFKLDQRDWQEQTTEETSHEITKSLRKAAIQRHQNPFALLLQNTISFRNPKSRDKAGKKRKYEEIYDIGLISDMSSCSLEDSIEDTEVLEQYRKAETGDSAAQYKLGDMYFNGIGSEINYLEAIKWYKSAAEQGHAEAQYCLGNMYLNGDGSEINHLEAIKWYKKAAEQGVSAAQSHLDLLMDKNRAQFHLVERLHKRCQAQKSKKDRYEKKKVLKELVQQECIGSESMLEIVRNKIAYEELHFNKLVPIIPKGAIQYGKELGNGEFGVVFQAKYGENPVVVKKLYKHDKIYHTKFKNEAIIMYNLCHPNLVTFLGFYKKDTALVMEYMSGGSLLELLERKKNDQSWDKSWQLREQIALDIAKGLSYLHDQNVVHGDLKSDNILLDHNMHAKIADFGMSALRNKYDTSQESSYGIYPGGLNPWMAPEVIKKEVNSKAGDVYSYGMILWHLGTRKEPFSTTNMGERQLLKHILGGNCEVISKDTPLEIRKVIELCWLPEPPLKKETDTRQRPEIKQVRDLLCKAEEKKSKNIILGNSIENIIKEWSRGENILTQLKRTDGTINLSYSLLTAENIAILAQHPYFKKIHLFYLENNQLGPEGATKLAQYIQGTNIHTLNLCNNNIRFEGVRELAKELPNTQIHTLYLSHNYIGNIGAFTLAQALPQTQFLHSIDLSQNFMGHAGVEELALALPNSQIHTLNLSWNKIGAEGAAKIADALPNSQIHTLNLEGNEIGAEGAAKIADALPNSQIHTLNLSWNKIGAEGAAKITDALSNSQIHTLYLGYNQLYTGGIIELVQYLQHLKNTNIEVLDLSGNGIDLGEVLRLVQVLPNTKIHTLDLSNNELGLGGTISLAQTLPKTKIHTLYIKNNKIETKGLEILAKNLYKTKIHTLDISKNNITFVTRELLKQQYTKINWKF